MTDRWWSLVAPGYDRAVALVGWHRALDALVADVSGGRLLDVGCGPGHLAPGLLARGTEYVGVDRDGAMLTRAARSLAGTGGLPDRGVLVRADVTALPFRDASFDVVVASAVLGLLDLRTRRAALCEMARVARSEVRLLEPVHRPGEPTRARRSRLVAWVRERPLELAELVEAGLRPAVRGPAVLGVYSVVRATRA